MSYKTLLVDEADGVLTVTLNRPDVHNAFNDELIAEAIDLFGGIGATSARAVVLRGTGPNFCAGADLNWMSRMVGYTREENIRDSSQLARMYALMNECPLPVIGRIQGRPSAAASASSRSATSPSPRATRSSGCPRSNWESFRRSSRRTSSPRSARRTRGRFF